MKLVLFQAFQTAFYSTESLRKWDSGAVFQDVYKTCWFLSLSVFNNICIFFRTVFFSPWLSVFCCLLIFPASVMTLGWEIFVGKTILKKIGFALSFEPHAGYITIWTICLLCFIYIKENMGVSYCCDWQRYFISLV